MPTELLKLAEVRRRTGLSRTAIYARMKHGRFPRNISLGIRAVGWVSNEVDAWVETQIAYARIATPTTQIPLPSPAIALTGKGGNRG